MGFLIHILLFALMFASGDGSMRQYVGYIYLVQYIYFLFLVNRKNKANLLTPFLKPSFLMLTYISLYFGLGSIYLSYENGLFQEMVNIYFKVDHFTAINVFFLSCNYIVFKTAEFAEKKHRKIVANSELQIKSANIVSRITLIVAIIVFLLFSVVVLDLGFIGGGGSFSYIPKVVGTIFIMVFLSSRKVRLRHFFYCIILIVFAIASFDSKREIIFMLLLALFIENQWNPIKFKINFRSIALGLSAFGCFVFFILISSINRGYGNYGVTSVIDAVQYVDDYANSDLFVDAVGDNFELNVVYGNTLNAAEMYFSDEQGCLYGETFLKAIFIFFPKSLIGYKPESMIQIYSPRVRDGKSVDVSYPVVIYSEFLWNFGVLFFLGIVAFIFFLDSYYLKIVDRIRIYGLNYYTSIGILTYAIFMQFVRGSGLDLFFLYVIVSLPFIYVLLTVNNINLRKR